jgi:hypothetical protein
MSTFVLPTWILDRNAVTGIAGSETLPATKDVLKSQYIIMMKKRNKLLYATLVMDQKERLGFLL